MYRDVPPAGIIVQTQVHVVLQRKGEPVHERRAGGDGVAVPRFTGLWLGDFDALQHRPTHFTTLLLLFHFQGRQLRPSRRILCHHKYLCLLLPSQHIPDMRTMSF